MPIVPVKTSVFVVATRQGNGGKILAGLHNKTFRLPGGQVKPGKDLWEELLRELKEETGTKRHEIYLLHPHPVAFCVNPKGKFISGVPLTIDEPELKICFRAGLTGKPDKLLKKSDELNNIGFYAEDVIRQRVRESVPKCLDMFRDINLWPEHPEVDRKNGINPSYQMLANRLRSLDIHPDIIARLCHQQLAEQNC